MAGRAPRRRRPLRRGRARAVRRGVRRCSSPSAGRTRRRRASRGTRMTAARTADLVADGGNVLALNVITLEHAEGILLGAERAGRPVVLQVSENAIRYHGAGEPLL